MKLIFLLTLLLPIVAWAEEDTSPANSDGDALTRESSCEYGYTLEHGECKKIQLSRSGYLATVGDNRCDFGFVLSGNSCRERTKNELLQQIQYLDNMLTVVIDSQRRKCNKSLEACQQECDSQFYLSSDKDKCLESCKAGLEVCD